MTQHQASVAGDSEATAAGQPQAQSSVVQERLKEIQRILENDPVDTAALGNSLTRLAKAFAIDLPGQVNSPLGGRQKLGLVPALPLPPVTAAGNTFFIEHSVDWSFSEGRRTLGDEDVDAVNLNSPTVDVLLRPKVVEAPLPEQSPTRRHIRSISPSVELTLTMQLDEIGRASCRDRV
jgi:hypothetical protein